MLIETEQLPVDGFPHMRRVERPDKPVGAGTALPIVNRPVAGNPTQADEFTGQKFFANGQVEQIVKRANHAYVQYAPGNDPNGKFTYGDLLLVIQSDSKNTEPTSDAEFPVRIIRSDNNLHLARLTNQGYHIIGPAGQKIELPAANSKVIALVKAVLLSLLKQ